MRIKISRIDVGETIRIGARTPLVEDVRKRGQVTPVSVIPLRKRWFQIFRHYAVVDGFLRVEAARSIGHTHIEARVVGVEHGW